MVEHLPDEFLAEPGVESGEVQRRIGKTYVSPVDDPRYATRIIQQEMFIEEVAVHEAPTRIGESGDRARSIQEGGTMRSELTTQLRQNCFAQGHRFRENFLQWRFVRANSERGRFLRVERMDYRQKVTEPLRRDIPVNSMCIEPISLRSQKQAVSHEPARKERTRPADVHWIGNTEWQALGIQQSEHAHFRLTLRNSFAPFGKSKDPFPVHQVG